MSIFNFPQIQGLIERRILINYRVDQGVASKALPKIFKPVNLNGFAMVGICLIRLKEMRPPFTPKWTGLSSENAAHRFAVEWDENGFQKQGVYIPRRDTSSKLNSIMGGRLFPGVQHHSEFEVIEKDKIYKVAFKNKDQTSLKIEAQETSLFPKSLLFKSLDEASQFFEKGALGYSPNKNQKNFQGMKLKTTNWKASPLEVNHVHSSYFSNKNIFPEGSVQFDHALLMKNIDHRWVSKGAKG